MDFVEEIKVTKYQSKTGVLFDTEAEAVNANVRYQVERVISDYEGPDDGDGTVYTRESLINLIMALDTRYHLLREALMGQEVFSWPKL